MARSKAAVRRIVYRKTLDFLANAFERELLDMDEEGRPFNAEEHAEAHRVFDAMLSGIESTTQEIVKCSFKECPIKVGADDFLCKHHWVDVPEHLRDLYLEEHQKGRHGSKGVLLTARAYIELEAERRHKNKR